MGFAVILSAIWWMPKIAYAFVKQRDEVLQAADKDLSAAATALGNAEIGRIRQRLQALETAIKPLEKTIQVLDEEVSQFGSLRAPADATTAVTEVVKQISTSLSELRKSAAELAPQATPDATGTNALWKAITELRSIPTLDPQVLTDAEAQLEVAVDTFQDPSKRAKAKAALDQVKRARASPSVTADTKAFKTIEPFAAIPTQLTILESSLPDQNRVVEALSSVVADHRDRLRVLQEKFPADDQGHVKSLFTAIRDTGSQLTNATGETLKALNEVAADLVARTDLQSRLADTAAAPGALMIIVIGAMFVTFGLSSLIGWLRLVERDQAGKIWRDRAELDAALVASLLAGGTKAISTESVISTLHTGLPRDEKATGFEVQTPLTKMLGELIEVLRNKPTA